LAVVALMTGQWLILPVIALVPMVELLVEYFVRHGTITPGTDENWSFTVPLREAQAPRPKAAVQ